MKIEIKLINYTSAQTNLIVSHYVIMQDCGHKKILLSHPNLYLYAETRQSENTSERYARIISSFYCFLSTLLEFQNIGAAQYHLYATNESIVTWQAQRLIERINSGADKPSVETITVEASLLQSYFHWLSKTGYPTGVNVILKTSKANFNDSRLLSYISRRTKTVIDSSTIRAMDKDREQRRHAGLITESEIKTLLNQYSDVVYVALFSLAIGTGMRPMDICKFPYVGNGRNIHIMPASMMYSSEQVIDFIIQSKGRKTRTVKIHIRDLQAIEEIYTDKHYQARAKLYEKRYGHPCPPSILFLTKRGEPVTQRMISDRTGDAKRKSVKADKRFRTHITFYHTRHWWPTYYLIRIHGENILTDHALVYNAAAEQAMIHQMGHGTMHVTYKYYIDMARLLIMARKGWMQDLLQYHADPVIDFISAVAKVDQGAKR
ncbi:tyrosine-type recombinase/integrase [Pseudomonas japonica]|uniref:tyrosine-type recombinase/integrase n=1 Tax=Pseudomonas japonica TaxID=256466 RepID=UPI0015E3C949|nr:tyrosine-type recombinase/integrase [Pseudomonas japonica]MBA1243838.1 site-specific integrase [Pseudomonas japonica]